MSEWLDLMLDEVARKQREAKAAKEENRRRAGETPEPVADKPASRNQSK